MKKFFTVVCLMLAGSPHVAVADGATVYHLLQTYKPGGVGGWDYLTVDSQARRFYISRGTHLQALNADSGRVIGDIPGLNGVHGIALAPKLGKGFTSNGRDNSVSIVDLKSLKVLGTVKVGDGPDCIVFEPVTGRVLTFNGKSDDMTAIDAVTGKVVGTVPLGGRPEFAAADGAGMVYDNLEDKGEIVAIDCKALTIKARWALGEQGPSGLAMDPKSRRLFSTCSGGKMVVLDADSGKVVATPPIGAGPDAAGFDPGTGLVFSSNGKDGTLTVLHEDTPDRYSVVQTVQTQAGARTLAVDTNTHRVFTVTATPAPAPPDTPHWKRTYLPGTFVVLVYGKG